MFYTFYEHIKSKYFEELQELSPVEREAEIFRRTCQEIPIAITPEDQIAGRYGCEDGTPYAVAEKKTFAYTDAYSPKETLVRNILEEKYRCIVRFHKAHTCLDYGRIIRQGLKNYEAEVIAARNKPGISGEKQALLEAMGSCVASVRLYARRFADLAASMGSSPRLTRMEQALRRVPYEPARDLYEAISAIWIMHTLVPISENSWASVSLGRLDQYLYPYYLQALKEGESEDTIKAYLTDSLRLLNDYGDGACALNIGGMDAEGNDEMNPLSRLLIRIEKEIAMPAPILAARISQKTPEDVFDSLIDSQLFTMGQPTFYGEEPCRNAVICRGVPEAEAVDFSVNSCMGLHIAGREIASMWGCMYNMHLPLELAINGGKPLFYQLPMALHTAPTKAPENLAELLDAYESYFVELLTLLLDFNRKNAANIAANEPNPLLSMLTEGCIETGLDRAVGAIRNTETVETMGLVNTANAICAIDTLVFRQKKYTLSDFATAAQQDFVSHEVLLRDIGDCEKYGAHSRYADGICQQLCRMVAKYCKALSHDNVYFLPSLHTLDSNVSFGNRLYTTLDGRLKGQPVNKNAGPTNDTRTTDPTGVILSAASLPQADFSGGQPIDLYFDPHMLQTKESRDKIKSLIKTYFQLGGLQVQVNSVDIELLEKAYENPKDYPMVLVRIGGYSRRFTELSRKAQQEFIERFRKEKGV